MNKLLSPVKKFSGVVTVPPDKSLTHRSVMLASLAEGTSVIHNPLVAEDCLSTAGCVESLGINVEKTPGVWKVAGRGLWGYKAPTSPLNCGNSGTTMRLISGILSAQRFDTELFGDASLSSRPMSRVAEPLRKMGASISLRDEKFAPMKIKGGASLKPIHWKSAIASAQVKSCVLLAGLHVKGETIFEEPSLSRDHSERMLEACGAKITRSGNAVSVQGPAALKPMEWHVPGDISSAAFFLVAGLLVKDAFIELKSVNLNPTRTGLLDVLAQAGAKIDIHNKKMCGGEPVGDLTVRGKMELRAFDIDEVIAPRLIDEIPVLAVAATQAKGTTRFKGIGELRVKETDRITALAANLLAMGADVREEKDGLIINGPTPLHGASVSSFDDHRIAMSFAVASLFADGQTEIKGGESVSISFPEFWSTLDRLSH